MKVHDIFKSNIGKDLIFSFITQMIIMLSVFALNKIISVGSGVEGYAYFNIFKKSGTVLSYFFLGGMSVTLPRYVSILNTKKAKQILRLILPVAITIIVSYFFLFITFLFFQKDLVGSYLLGKYYSVKNLLILSLWSFSCSLNIIIYGYYRGLGDYKLTNYTQIVYQLIMVVAVVMFYNNIILMFVLWTALTFLMFIIFVNKNLLRNDFKRIAQKRSIKILIKLLRYGFPRMLNAVVYYVGEAVPLLYIINKYGEDVTGLYSSSISTQSLIISVFSFTGIIFLQRVSMYIVKKDYKRINRIIRYATLIFVGVAILGILVILYKGQLILQLLYTKEFVSGYNLLVIISLSLIPRAVYSLLSNPIDAISVVPYNFINNTLSIIVYFVGLYISNDVYDCAWSYVASTYALGLLSIITWGIIINKRKEFVRQ